MPRPSQDRVKIEVWVKRASLQWLNEEAKRRDTTRSALCRELLAEAVKARQAR